jgi:hypothetical protein
MVYLSEASDKYTYAAALVTTSWLFVTFGEVGRFEGFAIREVDKNLSLASVERP